MKRKLYLLTMLTISIAGIVIYGCSKDDDNKSNQPPTCQITAPANNQQFEAGQSVSISADANDSDGTIEEVRFFVDDVGTGTSSSTPYNYTWNTTGVSIGNHTLKVTAIDNNGAQSSDEISVEITQASGSSVPVADFTGNPLNGDAPLTVNFIDESTNDPTNWQWDFGDGNTSMNQNPDHTYQEAGKYTITITVSNEYGSDSETKTDYINVGSSGVPCPGMETIEYGGQVYNTVLIGEQCWLKENLNYESGNSWCYENNPANCNTYGRLYDWESALSVCPSGWHLPSDEEWKILEGAVDSQYGYPDPEWNNSGKRGFDAGKNLKSTSCYGTNVYGFSALAGGTYNINGFLSLGYTGFWWSSDEYSTIGAWYRSLGTGSEKSYREHFNADKSSGFSVRCLRDGSENPPNAAFSADPSSGSAPLLVSFVDESINLPMSWQWDFGDGTTSNEQNPQHTYQEAGKYTVTITVSNEYGSDTETKIDYINVGGGGEPCPGIETIEYGGQVYNTVLIGEQCWLKENLNYEYGNSYCYDNNTTNCDTYGRLYDWGDALTVCPNGWHLPSDDEWKELEGIVDSHYSVGDPEWDNVGYRGFDAGENLKSISGWNNNGNGTDLYGFSALPGGFRIYTGKFTLLGKAGVFWSSTSVREVWYRSLSYSSAEINRKGANAYGEHSVRCVMD